MRNDVLKLIALITMVVDHVGAVFFPHIILLRIIGRLSFPIFAYLIALGYQRTHNIKKYFIRLFIFALVSQLPYMLCFKYYNLNIFFTLIAGLALLCVLGKQYKVKVIYKVSLILLICLAAPRLEYGIYGVLLIVLFYYFQISKHKALFVLLIIFNTIAYVSTTFQVLQLYSILALFLFTLNFKSNLRLNKYFCYAFYPGHLFLLYLLTNLNK